MAAEEMERKTENMSGVRNQTLHTSSRWFILKQTLSLLQTYQWRRPYRHSYIIFQVEDDYHCERSFFHSLSRFRPMTAIDCWHC
jgi:hypothetical protein